MTIRSARVQEITVGDDVVLTHQIVGKIALSANESIVPITLTALDKVNFFYENEDGSIDTIGYAGVPVGAYPTSNFTVAIAGIIPATLTTPLRGTGVFKVGKAQTVRAEITRNFATTPTKETHYLYGEIDINVRGFPSEDEEFRSI